MMNIEEQFEQQLALPFSTISGALHHLTGEQPKLLTLLQGKCLKEIREERDPTEILSSFLKDHPKYWDDAAKKKLILSLLDLMEGQEHLVWALNQKAEKKESSLSPLAVLEAEVFYQEIEQRAKKTLMQSQLHLSFNLNSNPPTPIEVKRLAGQLLEIKNKEELEKSLKLLLRGQFEKNSSFEETLKQMSTYLLPALHQVQVHLAKTWLSAHQLIFDLSPQITASCFCRLPSSFSLLGCLTQIRNSTHEYYKKEISKFALDEDLSNIDLNNWANAKELFQALIRSKHGLEGNSSLSSIGKLDSLLSLCRSWKDHAIHLDLSLSFSDINVWMQPHLENVHFEMEELLQKPPPKGVLPKTIPAIEELKALSQLDETPIRFLCIEETSNVNDWLQCCYFLRLVGFNRPFPFHLTFNISHLESIDHWVQEFYFLLTNQWYVKQIKERGNTQWLFFDWSILIQTHGLFSAIWRVYQLECRLAPIAKKLGIQLGCFDGKGNSLNSDQTLPYQWLRSFRRGRDHSHLSLELPLRGIDQHFKSKAGGKKWIEHLLAATWKQTLFPDKLSEPSVEDFSLIDEIAHDTEVAYQNIGIGMGFYGLGSSIQKLKKRGNTSELKQMYDHSRLFRLLLRECSKEVDSFFPSFCTGAPEWRKVREEYLLSRDHIRFVNEGKLFLMDDQFKKRMNVFLTNLLLPARVIEHYLRKKLENKELDQSWNSILERVSKFNR